MQRTGKRAILVRMKSPFVSLILLALSITAAAQPKDFYLKENDRVVFYGDSITDQRLYTAFTETFVVTRFPKLKVSFVHSGWGGDRVGGGGGGNIEVRLKRDVFAYNPTVMTIMLGMNDGSYRAFDQKIFDQYSSGYEHIVDAVKKAQPRIRITAIQPSPYDDVTRPPQFEGGYNNVLVRYGQFIRALAGREGLNVADLNTAVVAALEKAKASDAEAAKKIIQDRVHPGPAGQLLMAGELLKSWHAPRTVTAVEIDAHTKKVVGSESTHVSNFSADGKLSWKQSDAALPMAVDLNDPVIALAIRSSDFIESLDQQSLKVTGLTAAKYDLRIDGTSIGSFTSEQLAKGINLAILATPMAQQAKEVHAITKQHNDLHFTRWRQIQVPMANLKSARVDQATPGLLDALDEEEGSVIAKQRSAAQPKEHRYELVEL